MTRLAEPRTAAPQVAHSDSRAAENTHMIIKHTEPTLDALNSGRIIKRAGCSGTPGDLLNARRFCWLYLRMKRERKEEFY